LKRPDRPDGGSNDLDNPDHLRSLDRHGSHQLFVRARLIDDGTIDNLSRLRAVVLGSAAGGGVPQWNCGCAVCALAWSGDSRVTRRSQSSIAVTVDGENYALVNASPDLRAQILANAALHPRKVLRHSPIKAVIVTNADVDHVAGLLTLRERQAFALHATAATIATLGANAIFNVLAPDRVERKAIALNAPFAPLEGLSVVAFPLPGKVALWLEGDQVEIGGESEATIGLEFRVSGKRIVYAPGCAGVTDALLERVEGADILFFDGTTYTDDEMIAHGLSQKSAQRMGHTAMSGPDGALERFAAAKVGRKIFIHINNSNPALIGGSLERRRVEDAGWELAFDGMEVAP
jgi:pyrroloquinoline quinone biosynthesis protein B